MADLRHLNFDANNVEPNDGFEAIPAGEYLAVICESEWKATKGGTGQMLVLTFVIVEGEYQNRKLWARLNLENPSAQAVEIARGEFSAICRAVGVPAPTDSAQLHDLPLIVKVGLEKRQDTGEMANRIKKYISREAAQKPGTSPGAGTLPVNNQKPAQQGATSTTTTPPWKRGA